MLCAPRQMNDILFVDALRPKYRKRVGRGFPKMRIGILNHYNYLILYASILNKQQNFTCTK